MNFLAEVCHPEFKTLIGGSKPGVDIQEQDFTGLAEGRPFGKVSGRDAIEQAVPDDPSDAPPPGRVCDKPNPLFLAAASALSTPTFGSSASTHERGSRHRSAPAPRREGGHPHPGLPGDDRRVQRPTPIYAGPPSPLRAFCAQSQGRQGSVPKKLAMSIRSNYTSTKTATFYYLLLEGCNFHCNLHYNLHCNYTVIYTVICIVIYIVITL